MRLVSATLLACLLGVELPTATARASELSGFHSDRVEGHRALEARFDAALDAADLRRWMEQMTVAPHHVGAPQTRRNAEWMASQFESWGFETEIETFYVLFPTPKVRRLTLLAPERFEAGLREEAVDGDATSELAVKSGLPPFNAYSADGDVSGELVYVNQGVPRDYEELARRGIDVRGKIVIARYGGSWRGIKPKVAHERGAIGCLIYNDPRDGGFYSGSTYPDGAYKHASGVQRGSVLDLPKRPGDPLTPMVGATADAERLSREEADNLMRIPVLPISWQDAQPLLAALGGPVAPPEWRGALPQTYRMGPGPAKVRLRLEFSWDLVPAHNVVARLRGVERPDQWIVRGNHHDAWVIGADDPMSGLVALLAEAQAVGRLVKDGWRPRRTVVYAAWDAEEPALLGSTEWVEHHAAELRDKAAVYINSDSNGRGFLGVGGSHALERLVNEVATGVADPQTGVSVGERLRSRLLVNGAGDEAERLLDDPALRLGALGSGSDYSPFLQHLGIASLNVRFGGENLGGEYHTAFDSFDFYRRFGDPTFEYGVALAKTAGRLTLRLADADLLPFDFVATAKTVGRYVDEVEKLAADRRLEIARRNRLITEGHLQLAADPEQHIVVPETEPQAPYLNFAPLRNASDRLQRAAAEANDTLRTAIGDEGLTVQRLAELDRRIFASERALTRPEGLPRRPWFRHHLYAPGYYTGYSVKTLPGVREAIEEGFWEEAQEQIAVAAECLERLAAVLEAIAGPGGG